MQLDVQKYFLKHINEIRDKIFLIINRIFVSKEEAEDAIQEVILKLKHWQMDPEKSDGFLRYIQSQWQKIITWID